MGVNFKENPSLRKPILIACWLGMGMLARSSADYLIEQLDAKQFAEIRSPSNDIYFKGGVGKLSQYRHHFHYWHGEQGDLIICRGEIQPKSLSAIYQLANQVLDVAEEFGVKTVFTIAAVPNPRDVEPQIFGVLNKSELRDFLRIEGIKLAIGDGRITGLNGLLVGVAQQRGIDAVCLLCEIRYLDVPQPKSVHSVLSVLTKILDIKIDLSELERQAEEMEKEIERIREGRTPEVDRQREPRYIS